MRLFVGVKVPAEALRKISEACRPLDGAMGARLVESSTLHITLKFIGEAQEGKEREIDEALGKVKFAPFGVRLFGAGAFPSERVPRAIWIGGESEGACLLAAKIEEALSFLKLPRERFTLHLTVARSKGAADIGEFLQKTGEVCSFEARSFALMRSTLAAHGAIHQVLREYSAE